jgi:RNA polymerase sigma-70 factor (ECF subfamily)
VTDKAEPSDAELAVEARGGNDQAFAILMSRHKGGIFGFARRYVGDADAAFEIVQETFVSAWGALGRYDIERPFGVWLRAIALNKCRDRARRNAVRRFILGEKSADTPEAQRQADPAPNAEVILLDRQRYAALAKAIAVLPNKLKEPLLLTYFEDMSHQQAASLLGITVKAVETRIYRARQKLEELLKAEFRLR